MNTPIRIAAGVLAFGVVASAASAQACSCKVSHHRHHRAHATAIRYVAPVRYERRIVREPVVVRSYDSGYYGGGYYGGGYYDTGYSAPYVAPYSYTVVRPAYSYWRPSPVVVSYGDGYYWRHHHRRHHGWDRGWHRGWEHERGHGHWRD